MMNIFGRKKKKKIVKAKLGDENNFYFNDELKRWVERGKEGEAAADAPPAAPPMVAQPISQTVNATGIAAKYVDTGFGKPGESKVSTPKAIFTGKAAVQAPPPGMAFFVPQMPAQEPEAALNDEGQAMENFKAEAEAKGLEQTMGDIDMLTQSPKVKMADPLEDFPGGFPGGFPEEPGQKLASDPLTDVFGTGFESKSSEDLSDTDPLDDIFGGDNLAPDAFDPEDGSPMKDPMKLGHNNFWGDTEVVGSNGIHGDLDPEGGSPTGFNQQGQQDFWKGTELIQDTIPESTQGPQNVMDQERGHGKSGMLGGSLEMSQPQHTPDQDPSQEGGALANEEHNYDAARTMEDPGGVRAYWDEVQAAEFYQWIDGVYGDTYKTWSNEDWSNFWVWYNNPESHAQTSDTALGNTEEGHVGENQHDEGLGGERDLIVDQTPPGTIVNDTKPEADAPEKLSAGPELVGGVHATDMSPDIIDGLPEIDQEQDAPTADTPTQDVDPKDLVVPTELDDSKLAGSLPWSDGGSPMTTGVPSDSTSKSNISFGSTSLGQGMAGADIIHLNGFFTQLSAVLKNLTPGSEEIARQQADCQDQMVLLLQSMKKVNGTNHLNGIDTSHEKQMELRDQDVEIQTLKNQLKGARNEAAALQSELNTQSFELEELRAEKRRGPPTQKQARDWDVKCLREELEQTYHQQIYALQEEVSSKTAVIDRLQASRASASVADGSGGDLYKLRDELDNMEIAHRQQVSEIQTELDMRVLENENLREELERQSELIASLRDQLEIDNHEDVAMEDSSPRNGELRAQYETAISHLQKELEASSTDLEDLDAKVNMFMTMNEDSKSKAQELERALEVAQNAKSSLEMELKALREESSQQSTNEESPIMAAGIPSPEKFMLALGIADIQIGALSSKLLDEGVDVDLLISQALAEYIEQQ